MWPEVDDRMASASCSRPSHLLVFLQLLVRRLCLSLAAWCHLVLPDGRQPLVEVVVAFCSILLLCSIATSSSAHGAW
jgi:hypothetical protein